MVKVKLVVQPKEGRIEVLFGEKDSRREWYFGHFVKIEHNERSSIHNICCALKALNIENIEIAHE